MPGVLGHLASVVPLAGVEVDACCFLQVAVAFGIGGFFKDHLVEFAFQADNRFVGEAVSVNGNLRAGHECVEHTLAAVRCRSAHIFALSQPGRLGCLFQELIQTTVVDFHFWQDVSHEVCAPLEG